MNTTERIKKIEEEVIKKSKQMSSLHSENINLEETNTMLRLELRNRKLKNFSLFLYGMFVGLFTAGLIYIIIK